ncbi:pyridoxal phosphate biosynthetic protein PdxJ [Desulfurispirillum indicum S5]|uniref:Pyridoxine 5'-phosphate synthase n=2 Tax=Desulfurispirillum TaxID=393029 RepID=E6W481_DESIS|nr:pyridoxine 5'-phosphate synthase [Desulfurispirillum indicum]ADU67045.1 pyridoxal phosphate biosynthetic protein PdxJ [Desulfurispirillum indicum S5]
MMVKLGVNVDHVATVRQARRGHDPEVVAAAALAELGGADSITIHLREDRRHIQDRDVHILMQTVSTSINLEMACTEEMIAIACAARPLQVTLVPEKREELTTEGGLDVLGNARELEKAATRLRDAGIRVSFFIDANQQQIQASRDCGAQAIEIHTGHYADARDEATSNRELLRIVESSHFTRQIGLQLNAGHGLNYTNVGPIAQIPGMRELNIGHSIVARALFVGMQRAVEQMKAVINQSMGLRELP